MCTDPGCLTAEHPHQLGSRSTMLGTHLIATAHEQVACVSVISSSLVRYNIIVIGSWVGCQVIRNSGTAGRRGGGANLDGGGFQYWGGKGRKA
jgi:hypothetical protein